jgi:hypothetical protein
MGANPEQYPDWRLRPESGNGNYARLDEQSRVAKDGSSDDHPELPYEQKSYVCVRFFDGSRPVLYVTRPDRDWCFLCGDDHPDEGAAYRVVGLGPVIERDTSLRELSDLDLTSTYNEHRWEASGSASGF